ncbi:GNAT superfamily N-acetyltransferase [Silvimonas terrae]|uniref:GNAT superfamily N-acetyltransferase n=1 Tax=Silvimonas terrae TaxID=300266 RepID=A0A840RLM1_9NEIS|nr:GNAT family N-acetyltransferase [Silvimonas terrae]MBB5193504.1 GNAT superfamily N-acetyltransferase [Silvimonas terrae]
MQIRPLIATDHTAWLTLWQDYCQFYHSALSGEVNATLWQRLLDEASPINGLIALADDGQPLGFCHTVCHPHTWSARNVCYLEDLFVSPTARRMGVASQLIAALREQGQRDNWYRIYWITNTNNAAARAVYDKLATRSDHVRYEIALA